MQTSGANLKLTERMRPHERYLVGRIEAQVFKRSSKLIWVVNARQSRGHVQSWMVSILTQPVFVLSERCDDIA